MIAAVAAVVLLGGLGWAVFRGSGASPTTPTTHDREVTTTYRAQGAPGVINRWRHSQVTEVAVWEKPPPEWESAKPVVTWDARMPASQAEFDKPRPQETTPSGARYKTPTGWTFTNHPLRWALHRVGVRSNGNWAGADLIRPTAPGTWT
ncbi:MAG: hypothetical protein M5U19_11515 [Microthrixaceae bacterium]|nr:hypothetical protein [Microthrixaceae bacterium]